MEEQLFYDVYDGVYIKETMEHIKKVEHDINKRYYTEMITCLNAGLPINYEEYCNELRVELGLQPLYNIALRTIFVIDPLWIRLEFTPVILDNGEPCVMIEFSNRY